MTVLYRSDQFQKHQTGTHPECSARLAAIDEQLEQSGLLSAVKPGKIVKASLEEIQLIHNADYAKQLAEVAQAGGGRIESDTVMSAESYEVAALAAGTAIQAVKQVVKGEDSTALCLVRPPGHHALPEQAMGFCLFNNVALAAQYAVKKLGLTRILIVDWDVHHGNGTQHIFYEEEHITFFSSHRWPFYPGTGQAEETGKRAGLGTVFNLPIKYGTSNKDFLKAFEAKLQKAAEKCQPELVLVSAGFDAHRLDPIGSLDLETEDFTTLTEMVTQIAQSYCDGRLVSLLEGGYNTQALADSVNVHLKSLIESQK